MLYDKASAWHSMYNREGYGSSSHMMSSVQHEDEDEDLESTFLQFHQSMMARLRLRR